PEGRVAEGEDRTVGPREPVARSGRGSGHPDDGSVEEPATLEKLVELLGEEEARHVRRDEELRAEAEQLANEREQGDTQFDEESGEGDTVNVERERDLALSAAQRQIVEAIGEARARVAAGTYGLCTTCGDRIPVARLEVIPWTDQCVTCRARGERRR
ncbi:MAG: TraR/DksA family transcriptional regulator, partial [Actinomycetota bacterium]